MSSVESVAGRSRARVTMKQSETLAMIEDLEAEVKQLRKELERTSRKLTQSQARAKYYFDALRKVVRSDHPVFRESPK